jgi:hypothetical protein
VLGTKEIGGSIHRSEEWTLKRKSEMKEEKKERGPIKQRNHLLAKQTPFSTCRDGCRLQ